MKDHNLWKNESKIQSVLNLMTMMIRGEKSWFPKVCRKIEESNGSIVANMVTNKEIVSRMFLKAKLFSKHNSNRMFSPYAICIEGVTKAGIGPMNVAWQGTAKVILDHRETP